MRTSQQKPKRRHLGKHTKKRMKAKHRLNACLRKDMRDGPPNFCHMNPGGAGRRPRLDRMLR